VAIESLSKCSQNLSLHEAEFYRPVKTNPCLGSPISVLGETGEERNLVTSADTLLNYHSIENSRQDLFIHLGCF